MLVKLPRVIRVAGVPFTPAVSARVVCASRPPDAAPRPNTGFTFGSLCVRPKIVIRQGSKTITVLADFIVCTSIKVATGA